MPRARVRSSRDCDCGRSLRRSPGRGHRLRSRGWGAVGRSSVSSGSTRACWARISGWAAPRLRVPTVTTAPPETSDPVPEVVGTVTSGQPGRRDLDLESGESFERLALTELEPRGLGEIHRRSAADRHDRVGPFCACSAPVSSVIMSKVGSPPGFRWKPAHASIASATAAIAATGCSMTTNALVDPSSSEYRRQVPHRSGAKGDPDRQVEPERLDHAETDTGSGASPSVNAYSGSSARGMKSSVSTNPMAEISAPDQEGDRVAREPTLAASRSRWARRLSHDP